jgi:peptide/nickel transport system ATP-binding protein
LIFRAGQIVGLVGASGEGKSTLLRLVLGLEHPQHGQVLIDGHDLHKARGADLRGLRRKVQAVFQDPGASLDPRWRVGRIVAEPLGLLEPRLSPAERDRRVSPSLPASAFPRMRRPACPAPFPAVSANASRLPAPWWSSR